MRLGVATRIHNVYAVDMATRTDPTPTSADKASNFLAAAKADGFTVTFGRQSDSVVTVEKTFTPGDTAAYLDAGVVAYRLLGMCPAVSAGTTWGTTSDGVGGHAGLTGGYYRLSKSGVSKRFTNAAKKAL